MTAKENIEMFLQVIRENRDMAGNYGDEVAFAYCTGVLYGAKMVMDYMEQEGE